jgi:acyl-CoA synthetase (AMP-forming)/AMP-acid ligase II
VYVIPRLVDDDDRDITAPGAKGELLVRGPTIIAQYYENATANAASFDSEGYFRTGDIVTCEAADNGNDVITPATAKWYMVDRKKELIKVRGFQVSPAEVEAVILQHPAIVDAAVIGIKVQDNSTDGERPRAYVVRDPAVKDPTSVVTEADLQEWCAQRLAKYKALTGGVVFVDAVPRNAGGKLLKRVLREQAEREGSGAESAKAKL